MTVEADPTSSSVFLDDLNATYPNGAVDPKSEGDNHIRLIKKTIKNTFPNIDGAVTASDEELNILDGVTASAAELNALDGITATVTELNYTDGVTAAIQTQLDSHARNNLLINGAFNITNRSSSAVTSDDNDYGQCDRWKFLGDSTTIWNQTSTSVYPTAGDRSLQIIPSTSNKKIAAMQIIEGRVARQLQDKQVTFSCYLKGDANYDDVRIAILSWTGSLNAVTDPVSSWGASGTNPTWATSWTAENTPADLSVTTSWARYSVTATLDTASINNIAVVVFSNSTTPINTDSLYIAMAQLEVGGQVSDFDVRSRALELEMCARFYQSYDYSSGYGPGERNDSTSVRNVYIFHPYRSKMVITPVTTATYSVNGGASQSADNIYNSQDGVLIENNGASAGDSTFILTLVLDAEL
jgi:hypothetical protein